MNQGRHKRVLTETVEPAVAVVRNRFVGNDGEQLTAAGARARGVAIDDYDADDIAKGDGLVMTVIGFEEIESGAAFSLYAKLASDATGRGVTATAGQAVNAIAFEAATGAGQRCLALVLGLEADKVASAVIADPAGGVTVDAEARTAINAIIDALQAHGIVATA